MADVLQPTFDAFPETAQGAYARPTPVEPTRTWGEALKDTGLDLAAGAVRTYGRGFGGAADFVGSAIDTKAPTEHPKMDAMSDIETFLRDQRSDNAKYVDQRGGASIWREPGRYMTEVATGIAPYAPFMALGPWGTVPAGAAAFGTEQAQDLEMARSGDMSNNSQYLSMLQSGMTDKEARTKIAQQLTDPRNPDTYIRRAPATAGNMIGFGVGSAVTMKAARSISEKMVDRILAKTEGGGAMRATGIGMAEGAGAGMAMGAGTDYSRQAAEVAAGQRQEVDPMQMGEAAVEPASLFAGLTGAGKGIRRVRELSAKRAADAAAARAAEAAPEIGTDTLAAAAEEAHLDQPMPEGGYPPEPPPGGPRPPEYPSGGPGEIPEGGGGDPYYPPGFTPSRQPAPFNVPRPGERSPANITPRAPGEQMPPGMHPTEPSTPGWRGVGEPAPMPGEHVVTPGEPLPPRFHEVDRPSPYGETFPHEPYVPEPEVRHDQPPDPWTPEGVPGPYERPGPRAPGAPQDFPREPHNQPLDPWVPEGARPPGYGEPVTPTPPKGEPPKGGGAPPAPPAPKTPPPTPAAGGAAPAAVAAKPRTAGPKPKGETVAKSETQEEGRPKKGPAAEGVTGKSHAPEAQRQEESRAPVAQTETPVGKTPPADTGIGPRGHEALAKLRTAASDSSIEARLNEHGRVQLEKLREQLAAAKGDKPVEQVLKDAIEQAYNDPRNFQQRAMDQIDKRRAEEKKAERERKSRRTKPARKKREEVIKQALKAPGRSMADLVKGENRSVRDVFDSIINKKGLITFKDVPLEDVTRLANLMVRNAEERIKGAVMDMRAARQSGEKNISQIAWGLPTGRGKSWEHNPWYNALYDLNNMRKGLLRVMGVEPAKLGEYTVIPSNAVARVIKEGKSGKVQPISHAEEGELGVLKSKAGLVKFLLTDMYVLDRAIEMDKVHLWDRFTKENARTEFEELLRRGRNLEAQVARLQEMRSFIDEIDEKLGGTEKPVLTDEERTRYEGTKKALYPQIVSNETGEPVTRDLLSAKTNELVKHNQKIAEAHAQSGLDLYSQSEAVSADFENRIIEAMETRGDRAEEFIREHMGVEDAELIQRAREEKVEGRSRLNVVEHKTGQTRPSGDADKLRGKPGEKFKIKLEEIRAKQRPAEPVAAKRETAEERTAREGRANKRLLEIGDEADRINTALDTFTDETQGNVAHIVDTLQAAVGGSRSRTIENVDDLRAKADARMKALRDEARGLAEDVNPWLLKHEYGIRRILDPASDLSVRGNLPSGAYVLPVSRFLTSGKFGKPPWIARETSIRPTGEERPAVLLNHVFDVANRMIDNMEVVGLTAEQMGLALEHRLLPPETPAFYDPKAGRIFISQDVGTPNSAAFHRVLAHEIVHPLTEVAIEHFPEIGNRIEAIRKALAREVLKGNTEASRIMEGHGQALINTHEFISEFFSDGGTVQSALDTITLTAADRKAAAAPRSALLHILDTIKDGLFKLFLRTTHKTALSHMMVNSLDLFQKAEQRHAEGTLQSVRGTTPRPISADWNAPIDPKDKFYKDTQNWIERGASKIAHGWSRFDGKTGLGMWFQDLSQQARRFEPGMQAKVEAVRKALAHSYTSATRIMDEAHVSRIANDIARAMEKNPLAWDHFQDYYDFENQSSVSGSDAIGRGRNSWIHPTSEEHAQFRDDHAELSAAYKTMPKPFRDLRNELRSAYDARHEEMAHASLEQLIDLNKMAPDAATRDTLIKFIRDTSPKHSAMTAAERAELEQKVPGFKWEYDRKDKSPEYATFRDRMGELRGLAHLRKIPGVWYPKFRKGDWVTEGVFDMKKQAETHGGSAVMDEDGKPVRGAWEFKSEAERKAFMDDIRADPVLKKVKFSGLTEMEDAAGTKFYRARYNPLMLDFHKTQLDAVQFHRQLKERFGDKITLTHPEPRRIEDTTYLNPVKADRALSAMMGSLQKSEGWADLDRTSQSRLERSMNEGAARYIMGASARATYLPRRYALGSRKDVMQDFLEYFVNTSYSLAELRHRNELKTSYKGMDTYVEDMKTAGEHEKYHIGRRQLQASLHRRADYRPDPILSPLWKRGLARTLQLSYLDKLVSPMNWVLNGSEPWMSGLPMLAGVHGMRVYPAFIKALNDIGFTRYMDGFKDAATVYKAGIGGVPEMPDVPQRFKEMTKDLPDAKEIHAMIDYFEEYAHLDRDSSMEVGRIFDPTANKFMRGIDWGDNITRQISANIDNVNRIALGIVAMRMSAEGKGSIGGMEGRLAHAEKYVGKMAGNYAKYNEAEMFRHPALGPMLQFKRYAQRMTANWIGVVHDSFFRDVAPEDKAVARRQLMYMMGTVMFVSGALGLPWEPIKGVINAFSPLTGTNSDDVEDLVRRGAAAALGKDLGYAFTRGVPRAYLNMGIGTRLGLDSMWTQGSPGNRPDSWYASIGHFVLGAPGSYGIEALEGVGRLAKATGNFARGESNEGWNNLRHGAQLITPIKAFADSVDSVASYMGGPSTRTRFGQPLGYQPTELETAMQIGGMRSGRSQERGDLHRQVSRDNTKRQDAANEAYNRYVHAEGAEKTAIRQQAMAAFNRNWPDNPLTVGDFVRADARFGKQMKDMMVHPERAGLTLSRKQQKSLPRYEAYEVQ